MSHTQGRWTSKAAAVAVGTIAALFTAGSADASVLMLDFGPFTATESNLTNSPYHTANPDFDGTTWNQLSFNDATSGLLYADGSTATDVSLNLGSLTSGTEINLSTNPNKSHELGGAITSGVYAGNSVGRDAIWTDGKGSRTGAQITGLPAGTYEVYVTARNTNAGAEKSTSQTVFVGKGEAGVNFDTDDLASVTMAYPTPTFAINAWSEGDNYAKFTVTLGEDEALNIAMAGTEAGAVDRGFLNSIQVVPVPEPSSLALLGLGGLPLMRRRRG